MLLTGLRPAAMKSLKAGGAQVLFICLLYHTHTPDVYIKNKQCPTNARTQRESTIIARKGSLMTRLSSAELWRKPHTKNFIH